MLVVSGSLLILVGWFTPWASAGAGSVSGLSDAIAPWFRVLVLSTGLLGFFTGALVGFSAARWGVLVAAGAGVGWSLVFPAVVYVGARALAGYADAPAAVGPVVTRGAGAYALALGVVAVMLGCGPVLTDKRVVWIGTIGAALISGLMLLIGLI